MLKNAVPEEEGAEGAEGATGAKDPALAIVEVDPGNNGMKSPAMLFDIVLDAQENRDAPVTFVGTVHLGHRFGVSEAGDFSELSGLDAMFFKQATRT